MASTSDSSEPAAPDPVQAAEPSASRWYPPLPLWKLFLLLFLTLGIYSAFYLYRTARELREHGQPQFRPWLYAISFLLAPATGIASARLARAAREQVPAALQGAYSRPALLGLLVFATSLGLSAGSLLPYFWVSIVAVLAYCIPWLLLQRQLNLVKAGIASSEFITAPNRYTKLQIAALSVGVVMFIAIGFTLQQEFVRMMGEDLDDGVAYLDPAGRFTFVAPREGWTVLDGPFLNEDSDLELLGPGPSDWAIIYVNEQAGLTVDDLVEDRYRLLGDAISTYREIRKLIPRTEIAVSHAEYRTSTALDGPAAYAVTTFATRERSVEMIVYTAGVRLDSARGRELAESMRPVFSP